MEINEMIEALECCTTPGYNCWKCPCHCDVRHLTSGALLLNVLNKLKDMQLGSDSILKQDGDHQ